MQITSGWLNLSSDFLFLLCTLASGCWRQVQHIGFSLGGHCFPLLFPAGEFAGVGTILLHIGGYPTSCVRLCPMGVFQWHRDELCTLSCGRRDGPDGGTPPPRQQVPRRHPCRDGQCKVGLRSSWSWHIQTQGHRCSGESSVQGPCSHRSF